MPNAKVLIRQSFKPLTKEKKLEVWNKVKTRIATGEYCEITAKEYRMITAANRISRGCTPFGWIKPFQFFVN